MYKGGLFKRNARQISKVIVHGIRQKQHFEVFFNGEEFAYSNVYAQLCGHSKFRVCCWDMNFNTRNSLEIRNKKLTWWIIPFLFYFPTFHCLSECRCVLNLLTSQFTNLNANSISIEPEYWALSTEQWTQTETFQKTASKYEKSWFWLVQWYARNR